MRLSRLFFWMFATSGCGAMMLLGIAAAMQSEMLLPYAQGLLVIAAFSIFGYAIALVREMGRLRHVLALALAMAVIGMVAMVGLVIVDSFRIDGWQRPLMMVGPSAASATVFGGLLALLISIRLPSRLLVNIRRVTLFAAGAAAIGVSIIFIIEDAVDQDTSDLLARLIAVFVLLMSAGIMSIVAGVYLRKLRGEDVALVEPLPLTVVCPRCGLRQGIMTEGARCSACKLSIRVRVA